MRTTRSASEMRVRDQTLYSVRTSMTFCYSMKVVNSSVCGVCRKRKPAYSFVFRPQRITMFVCAQLEYPRNAMFPYSLPDQSTGCSLREVAGAHQCNGSSLLDTSANISLEDASDDHLRNCDKLAYTLRLVAQLWARRSPKLAVKLAGCILCGCDSANGLCRARQRSTPWSPGYPHRSARAKS